MVCIHIQHFFNIINKEDMLKQKMLDVLRIIEMSEILYKGWDNHTAEFYEFCPLCEY